jgi:TetR/AcrR family tetracycline transcriptional repressor
VSTPSPRLVRQRGGTQQVPLAIDDVVSAAVRLVEREGLSTLTIKAVADELGVTSPAVYHYVAGKDALVERVCERVASLVRLDVDDHLSWDEQILAIIVGMHHTFAHYPGVGVRVLSLNGPAPAARGIAGRVVGIACAAGFSERDSVRLNTALQLLFSGWLLDRAPFIPDLGDDAGSTALSVDVLVDGLRFLLAGFAALRPPAPADGRVTPSVLTGTDA